MSPRPDPRRAARLTVPLPLGQGTLAHHHVHLLDLSPLGARLRHRDLLHAGVVCYLDLPLALGGLRLTGCIVWTELRGTEQAVTGERWTHYESGIEFQDPTPAQQTALAVALASLQESPTNSSGAPAPPAAPPPREEEPSA
jgi:hypothetical protein